MKLFPSSELEFTAFVTAEDKAAWPRLPVLRVSWLEDKLKATGAKITEAGYRRGMKPGNWGKRFPAT